jgi:hypothetical protein
MNICIQIEALTVEGVPAHRGTVLHANDVIRYARAIEMILRSISNLLERFHQSFFLYREK